ncbi:MAG: DEAD/DEAH box helicase [Hyphomicrobiaceae bacterium]
MTISEKTAFSELGLSEKVLAAITAAGYAEPTPIQAKAIPHAIAGRDVLGIAQTGTGKTASFVLPMLTRLEQGRARARMPRSLIIAPTRELAAQVAENFEKYGAKHRLTLALLIGGVSFDEQEKKLDRGADVLIATPGRLLDHFTRGKLLLTGVEILVIDEADRMLDMGFIPDIERICSLLPPRRQTLFFSATMPAEIQRLVDRFLKEPARVEVAPQSTTAGTISQRFVFSSFDPRQKREALRTLIRGEEVKNAIIFCNRKRDVDILYKSLVKHGFNAGALHGDMDQRHRMATLDAFRSGELTFLAASDVAARGLDIPDVSHVFNYDVPIQAEDYVHRIGRTGRAGRKGFSATIVTDDDMRTLKEIARLVKSDLEWIGEPPPEDAGTKSGRRARAGSGDDRRDGDRRGGRGGRDGRDGRGRGMSRGRDRVRSAPEDAEHMPAIAAESPADDAPMPAGTGEQPSIEGRFPGEERAREGQPRRSRGGRGRGRTGPRADRSADEAAAEGIERTHSADAADSPEGRSQQDRSREDGTREDRPRDGRHRDGRSREPRHREERSREGDTSARGPRRHHRPLREHGDEAGTAPRGRSTEGRSDPGRSDQGRPDPGRPDPGRPDPGRFVERSGRPPEEPGHGRGERRRDRRDRDDGPGVVGLGDHVPDFLKRPVKPKAE